MNGYHMNVVRQYCTFFVDLFHFAIDVDHVQEVGRPMPTTPVPLTSEVVDGLVNLRGQIVTAVDLRSRLELPRREDEEPLVSLIVRTSSGLISLRVDRLGDVLVFDDSSTSSHSPTDEMDDLGREAEGRALVLESLPDTATSAVRDIAQGIIQLEETLLLVLDPDLLLTAAVSLQPEESED
jgi:purine-binding chemotaxis protein CheW